jgi:glycosyltransferase involved in cell wall biosynthesis
MRILILTQNYFPEPDPKMHILAKGLVARGHSLTVLTGFPNYPHGEIYPGYKQKMVQRENIDGVQVIRIPLYPDRSRSIIKRSLNYLSFPVMASILGPFICEKADIILVYHPPVTLGLPAFILSRLRRIPFVFEIQDMWPETLPATGMVSNPYFLSIINKIANFTYSKSAAITVISPGFKRNLESKGVAGDKVKTIYNWAYEGEFKLGRYDDGLAEQVGLKNRFNILYAGNMGPAQGMHNVVEAASLLTEISDIQFVLLGSGIDKDSLEMQVAERNLHNVRFIQRVPMEKMPIIYSMVNAVMVHLTDDPLFEITIPGKTQSSLLSGKPIIACVNGDAAELVLQAKAGIAVRAMDPIGLADACKRLYRMAPEERESMGINGRTFYINNLSPHVQIPKYEELFEDILNKAQR